MAVSAALMERSKSIVGVQQWVYQAVAMGLEVIPRTLANNCGANVMKLLTELRAQHAKGNTTWGIDGVQVPRPVPCPNGPCRTHPAP